MIAGRTRAVLSDMLDDIKRALFYTTLIVQIIFFVFYANSIYNNIDKVVFLVIYIALFLLSIILFVNYLINHSSKSKKVSSANKRFERTLKFCKYAINGTMLVINLCEMIKYGSSDLNKILLIVSAVALVVQVILEFIKMFAEKHIKLLKEAWEEDFKFFYKFKDFKGNFFELVDAPAEKIAKWIEKRKGAKEESEINQIKDEFETQKKAEEKQKSEERVEKEKNEFKRHMGIIKDAIFKKKTK